MGWLIFGIIVALVSGIGTFFFPEKKLGWLKWALRVPVPIISVLIGLALASVYFVDVGNVAIVDKKFGPGGSLKDGRVIAVKGENGIQGKVLRAGLHLWQYRWQLNIKQVPLVEIKPGQIGTIETIDGLPMPPGKVFAPEWPEQEVNNMLDAEYYMGKDTGQIRGVKGPQLTILGPGKYALNTKLFNVKEVPVTTVKKGQVAVIKANVEGVPNTLQSAVTAIQKTEPNPIKSDKLVRPGEIGIWDVALGPGQYWVHPAAFEIAVVDVRKQIQENVPVGKQTTDSSSGPNVDRSILIRTADAFEFLLDTSVVYHIEPQSAPIVVATIGSEAHKGNVMPGVSQIVSNMQRKVMRDKAGKANALQYIADREEQGKAATEGLQLAVDEYGITIDDVNIRDWEDVPGSTKLAELLNTQTQKQLAEQLEKQYAQQEIAAQAQKKLNKTQQEAEEEKTLAAATYDVKRQEQTKQKIQIAAEAEALKVTIEAKAQADAIRLKGDAEADRYGKIVTALGPTVVGLIELSERINLGDISVPEMLIIGGDGAASTSEALVANVLKDIRQPALPANK
jgi:regulator of protease activity HflC (stomatin/prohibitin superfamily)